MSLNAVSKMKGIVAPLVGAWIESKKDYLPKWLTDVAPLVGAWIERGGSNTEQRFVTVAPLVGAWIESTLRPSIGGTVMSLLL